VASGMKQWRESFEGRSDGITVIPLWVLEFQIYPYCFGGPCSSGFSTEKSNAGIEKSPNLTL